MLRVSGMLWLCAMCVLVGMALPAGAHDLGLSGIRVLYRSHDVVVNVTTPISRLRRAEGKAAMSPAQLDQAIRRRLHVRFDGNPLSPQTAHVIGDSTADMLSWQTVLTGPVKVCEVTARLYPEDPNSRTVVVLIRGGQVFQEALLDAAHPDLLRSQSPLRPIAVALRYVHEGIGHIFGGPDHILFVLGLILLGGTLKSLLKTVTAFTLAHSVTLTLAATGVFSPSPRIVEPLIALSIVAIAVENLRHRGKEKTAAKRDLRPYYAFSFGLVHGFGFAGALAQIGLPREALGVALASFNIGVEVGQVAIILAALPLLTWLGKARPIAFSRLVPAGSVVIGVVGAYWFFSRLVPF
jgi:hypothetical protein